MPGASDGFPFFALFDEMDGLQGISLFFSGKFSGKDSKLSFRDTLSFFCSHIHTGVRGSELLHSVVLKSRTASVQRRPTINL